MLMGPLFFIRIVDQLLDLLNSRSPFDKGFKKPLFLHDATRWKGIVERYVNYLIKLTDKAGLPLVKHRRKRFALGFITA